jgi:hypothetical protein
LQHVELSGPTFFEALVSNSINFAKANMNKNTYSVMVILTDGAIHDMQKTIDYVVEAS